MGFIIRNEEGEVVSAACGSNENVVHLALAKCLALLRVTEFFQAKDLWQVILKGDPLQIVHTVNNRSEDLSWFGHLIEAIKYILKLNPSWSIQHVGGDRNKVAHRLVKEALKSVHGKLWIEDFPKCIIDLLSLVIIYINSTLYSFK